MNYEDAIKAKHEFQDSFESMLSYLSVMDYRELELSAAKIADAINAGDRAIERQSGLITGKILQIMLELRNKGEVKENKIRRIWMTRKKRQFANKIARRVFKPEYEEYKDAAKKVEHIRNIELRNYHNQVRDWQKRVDALPFFKRVFQKPSRPQMAGMTPYPYRPNFQVIKDQILSQNDFSQILVRLVVTHCYPYPEYGDSFVEEAHVKNVTLKLLEDK